MEFVIEFETGVYMADWVGDPGRTLDIENAAIFEKREEAEKALRESIKEFPEREWSNPLVILLPNHNIK